MVTRVTAAEVRVLLAPYADNSDVTLFIEQANLLVEEDLVGKGLSVGRLRLIELYLAAHFAILSIERGGFTRIRTGNSEEEFAKHEGKSRFSSSRFGQVAMSTDTTGTLTAIDSPLGRAEFQVYG